jgi:molybdate transport system ATP-binding protein
MSDAIDIALDGQLGNFRIGIDISLPMHGISVLFGPSGCGKTSVLRAVAGLNRIPGRIAVGGQVWQDRDCFVPIHKRALGYVFQEASLFPHLSVRQNLTYGERRVRDAEKHIRFDEVVNLLGIGHLVERSPENLSGGERQRVSIGRALLSQPRVLLMDEPLSALDRMAKDEVLPYFEALHAKLKIPILLVTHDMSELERLADYVVLMRAGRVLAAGPLHILQSDPALPLAFGRDAAVTLDGIVEDYDASYGLARLKVDGGSFTVPLREAAADSRHRLTIAAGDVSLAREVPEATTLLNILPARILSVTPAEHEMIAVLGLGKEGSGNRILARVTRRSWDSLQLREGLIVHAQVKSVALAQRSVT